MVERNLNRWTIFFAVLFFVNAIMLLKDPGPSSSPASLAPRAVSSSSTLAVVRRSRRLACAGVALASSRLRISIASARSSPSIAVVVLARELAGAVVELGVADLAVLRLARRLELLARDRRVGRALSIDAAPPAPRARASAPRAAARRRTSTTSAEQRAA